MQCKRTAALKWVYLATNALISFANSVCNARAYGRGTFLFQTPVAAKDLTHSSLGLSANASREGFEASENAAETLKEQVQVDKALSLLSRSSCELCSSDSNTMISLCLLVLYISCGQCASMVSPTNNSDTYQTLGWQPDPNGRGTFTVVSSCLLTLGICVYSAMHLNVPPYKESSWLFWFRTCKWGLLGVFGPELVIFLAWKQLLSARDMVQRSQDHRPMRKHSRFDGLTEKRVIMGSVQELTSSDAMASPWTLVHGFYAGMGGFMFQSHNLSPDHRRLTLTARGVALLAECGLLPDIEKEDILDKSKSDGLSKLLACVQAAWMMVEVIGRRIGGLQITLLEINTLAHVFCALITYVIWWHKPQLVKKPTTLDGDWTAPLCAYMYMSSRVSGRKKTSIKGNRTIADTEMSLVAFYPRKGCPSSCVRAGDCHNVAASQYPQDSQERGSFRLRPMMSQSNQSSLIEASRTETSEEVNVPDSEQNLRWCLAAEAIIKYPAIKKRFETIAFTDTEGHQTTYLQEEQPEELLVTCSTNWSREGLLPGQFGLVMGMVLWSVSVAYGGIHAAAWDTYFPSKVESKMWRFSALYISSSGLLWCIINMLAKLWRPFDEYWNRTVLPHPPFAKSIPLVACCAVCGAMYILVRTFLVIEAFISIRQLPASAYETPNWTQLIPHF